MADVSSRKVALITGAAKRIGRAIAEDLAAHGWSVGLHCHASREEADAVAEGIRGRGGRAVVLPANLADAQAVQSLVPACAEALGPPICLVNNAALFINDEIISLDPAVWDLQMAVNLKAPVLLAGAMARALAPEQTGTIINIVDQRVWRPVPSYFSYGASKSGLWGVTRTLAQALAPRIRVNAIGPGPVLANVYQSPADFAAECASTPLGRATRPQEIADAVRFIIDAPAMTGQMIALDGGQHLAWEGKG
ncbi:MAG: SDR family oxidoreductase [Hyphomicrobiales bacterium]|nr:MAG: SDR family oxidoreductase [Hyphomicrobiales bacterium]